MDFKQRYWLDLVENAQEMRIFRCFRWKLNVAVTKSPDRRYCGVCGWTFHQTGKLNGDMSELALNFRWFTELARLSTFETKLLQLEVAVEAFQDDIIVGFLWPMRARNEGELMALYARAYGSTLNEVKSAFERRHQKWAVNAALPTTDELFWPMHFPVGLGRLGPLIEVLKASYFTSAGLSSRLVEEGLLP